MKTLITLIIAVIVGLLVFWYINGHVNLYQVSPSPSVTTSGSPAPTPTTSPAGNQTVSTGVITFGYGGDWALATTANQVTVRSYIPPCDTESMDYCLFYNGSAYTGTNFESAGIRIQKRTGLITKTACTNSLPDGYTNLVPTVKNYSNYSTSVFSPLSDAAAGHYANGALYRLWTNNTCYEFETRIGETQYANYPSGAIKLFTDADRTNVMAQLKNLLAQVTINSSGVKPFAQ